jgi:uncharacterized protein YkwD
MRFSAAVLSSLGAALVVASPVHRALHNREIVWDIITEIEYVTVTEGVLPTPTGDIKTVVVASTLWVQPIEAAATSTSVPPPAPPAPTTTSTTEPPPAPTTTEAPAPPPAAPATIVAAVQQPAPVVVAPAPVASDYQSAAVIAHNVHRANHSAPDMSWSDSLAASAQIVASSCVFAHNMNVNGGHYGQNLAAYGTSSSNFGSLDTASIVAWSITESWYNGEAAYIPFGQNSPSGSGPEYFHATQVIWKSSVQVGCATVSCAAGTIFPITDPKNPEAAWYTVCNYGPQGNVLGTFNSEISPPLNHGTVHASIS